MLRTLNIKTSNQHFILTLLKCQNEKITIKIKMDDWNSEKIMINKLLTIAGKTIWRYAESRKAAYGPMRRINLIKGR